MADNLAELIAERERRSGGVTGGSRSVLDQPEETTTLQEVKRAVTSLLKGSTKGVIDVVGGWGNLYDYIKKSKEPNPLSSVGLVNAINNVGGPDLMKIEGYKGLYQMGQAGGPAALLSTLAPGSSLFRLATPARTACAEFTTAGTLGLLSQQVAPESPMAQLTLQTLPYLVVGGVRGYSAKGQQDKINEYKKLLPEGDKNIFDEFMLRGQASSDPVIAADIARLSRSPKYLELITALNEGASKKAVLGVEPKGSVLTQEQAKTAIIQSIEDKLSGMRDSKTGSLFEKAKGYGAKQGLVDPKTTIANIDGLIARYSEQTTPNAIRAVEVLKSIKDRLSPSFTTQGTPSTPVSTTRTVTGMDAAGMPITSEIPTSFTVPGATPFTVNRGPQKLTVEQTQGILSEFGKKASAGDNLIKDLSISDERLISSAIFGGMKQDLRAAVRASSGDDRAALNLLSEARERVAKSSEAYNEAISQGLPKFLQDKSLIEVSPEQLFQAYKELTPNQRATMRSWVSKNDSEALAVLDKQVFDDFVGKARTPNALGVETVNLELMAKNWRGLNAIDKDTLVTALGTNATEFGNRMKDAELMTRKMSVSQPTIPPIIGGETVREASAVLGAAGGYATSKVGQLGLDIVNSFAKGGLNEDQLMKALLTPEGAQFLKTASLSPRSANVLSDLTKMENSNPVARWMVGTTARFGPRMASAEQPTVQTEEQAMAGAGELEALLQELALRQQQQPMTQEQ
jgi:hypothetical protein